MKKIMIVIKVITSVGMGMLLGYNYSVFSDVKKKENSAKNHNDLKNLYALKDVAYEKFIPDSLKHLAHDASYELMFVNEGNNDYWKFRRQLWEVEDFAKKIPALVHIDSLIKVKEKEVE